MGGCYDNLGRKVDTCVALYKTHHGKFPDAAVLTEDVYDLFSKNNLLMLPSGDINPDEIDESNERACLQNALGKVIDVYTMDQVPAKIRHQLKQSEIEVPLHLCRAGLIRQINPNSLDSFNLEATTDSLRACI